MLIYLIHSTTLYSNSRYCYCHFPDEETEAKRGYETCLRSHTVSVRLPSVIVAAMLC